MCHGWGVVLIPFWYKADNLEGPCAESLSCQGLSACQDDSHQPLWRDSTSSSWTHLKDHHQSIIHMVIFILQYLAPDLWHGSVLYSFFTLSNSTSVDIPSETVAVLGCYSKKVKGTIHLEGIPSKSTEIWKSYEKACSSLIGCTLDCGIHFCWQNLFHHIRKLYLESKLLVEGRQAKKIFFIFNVFLQWIGYKIPA